MLFNSLDFAIFLPIVFVLYWFVTDNNLKLQNFLVLVASYVFYGWWDWRFLSLIIFSTLVDYSIGRKLGVEDDDRKRKYLLWTSVANLRVRVFGEKGGLCWEQSDNNTLTMMPLDAP